MRKVTVINETYEFDELNEDAQQEAIDRFRENENDYDWWNYIYEDLQYLCKVLGIEFKTEDISFSIGKGGWLYVYSQNITFTKWHSIVELPIKFGAYQNYLGGGINSSIQSVEADASKIEYLEEGEDGNKIIDTINEALSIFEDKLIDLWKEYEYINDDENIIANIKEQRLEFFKDGTVI